MSALAQELEEIEKRIAELERKLAALQKRKDALLEKQKLLEDANQSEKRSEPAATPSGRTPRLRGDGAARAEDKMEEDKSSQAEEEGTPYSRPLRDVKAEERKVDELRRELEEEIRALRSRMSQIED